MLVIHSRKIAASIRVSRQSAARSRRFLFQGAAHDEKPDYGTKRCAWDELFPAEQARIVQLLIERLDVAVDGTSIRLRTEGMASLVAELQQRPEHRRAA